MTTQETPGPHRPARCRTGPGARQRTRLARQPRVEFPREIRRRGFQYLIRPAKLGILLQLAEPPTNPGWSTAKSQLRAVLQRADQLHQEYLAAAEKLAAQLEDGKSLWERTELPRQMLEWVLAPTDLAGGDHWVALLKKAGEEHEQLFEDADEAIEEAMTACREGGDEAIAALIAAGDEVDRAGNRLEIWDAIAPGWVKGGASWASEIRGLAYGLSAAGILADTGTIVSPEDSGGMAVVDRSAALVNAGAIAADTAIEAGISAGWIAADGVAAMIPGLGEVAIAITGAYLAGDFIYHHRAQLADAAKDIGHALVHADETVARWEVEGVTAAEDKAAHVTEDAGHAARSMWHSISSTVGSWF
jgi:hypothetical protein